MGRGGQDEPAGKSEITLVTRAKNWDLFSTGDRELVFCSVQRIGSTKCELYFTSIHQIILN